MNIQNLQAEILRCGAALTQQGVIRIAEQLGWGLDHWQASDAILTRSGYAAVRIPWNMTSADLRQRLKVLFQARLQEGRSLAKLTPASPVAQRFIDQMQHWVTDQTITTQPCEGTPKTSPIPIASTRTSPTPIASTRTTPTSLLSIHTSDLSLGVDSDQDPVSLGVDSDQDPDRDPDVDPDVDPELLDAFVTALTLVVEQSQMTFLEVAGEQFRHLQQQLERYELEQIQVLDDTLDELVRQHQRWQTRLGRSPQPPDVTGAADILPQAGYPTPAPSNGADCGLHRPDSDALAVASAQTAALAEQVADLQQQLRHCQGKLAQAQRTLGRTQARLRTARATIAQGYHRQDEGWGDRWLWGEHPRSSLIWTARPQVWMRPVVWATGMVMVLVATAWITMVIGTRQAEQSSLHPPSSLSVLLGRLPHLTDDSPF